MLRRSFSLIFALLAALAIYELHDVAVWRSLLSAGVPVAIVDGLRNEWWWIFVGLVVAHYAFFTLLPFFNPTLGWLKKCVWAGANLMLYPFIPALYTLVCTRDTPAVRAYVSPRRRR